MQESNFKLLKGAVIMGGALLVIATIGLFVILAKKIAAPDAPSCTESPSVTLPEGANIIQTQMEKALLHITIMHSPEHYEILTIDRCNGDISATIKIKTPNPPPTMPFG